MVIVTIQQSLYIILTYIGVIIKGNIFYRAVIISPLPALIIIIKGNVSYSSVIISHLPALIIIINVNISYSDLV